MEGRWGDRNLIKGLILIRQLAQLQQGEVKKKSGRCTMGPLWLSCAIR